MQKKLGADIIIPLDHLPPYHIDPDDLAKSVALSHRFAPSPWHDGRYYLPMYVFYSKIDSCYWAFAPAMPCSREIV